jgi:outer membrane protein OmpA-like peptidoglycan-associated protein
MSKYSAMKIKRILILSGLLLLASCVSKSPVPIAGPDKQGAGLFSGAALGATSGAVTGAQLTAGAGPGAMVGAGVGAVFGMFSGLGTDLIEEDQLRRAEEERYTREVSWAHEVLAEHYSRRLELHPTRDIYPADMFFDGDSVMLKPSSEILVKEIIELSKQRMPWSRLVVAAYITSRDPNSTYATYLTEKRSAAIAKAFAKNGVDPRRMLTQPVVLTEAVLIDPYDSPNRYRQAIEIIPIDF